MRDVAESARGTVDAFGRALLTIRGPHRNGSRWALTSVVLRSTGTSDGRPTAAVYRGTIASDTLLGESRAADSVTFDARGDWLHQSDQLLIVVENASPGSTVTANLFASEPA